MHKELLFEIGTEEIPAGYLSPALEAMRAMLADHLRQADLAHGAITVAGTPRRLVARVAELAARQPDRREQVIGPPRKAAFDANGNPTKAALGFARSRGIAMEDTEVVATERGEYLAATVEIAGRPANEVLGEILPAIITSLPFPKSMRWGSGTVPFARPIQWLLALYGGEVIPIAVNDVVAGRTTRGHRFHAPQEVEVRDFADYCRKLEERHVLVDPARRRQALVERVTAAATAIGGRVVADDELVATVTNLVEEPHPVVGAFDERFLALPREVLITSMREHQKYFAVEDEAGRLRPHFVAVNNTRVRDASVAVEGHQRVIRARLEDAWFFFREDCKRPLADRVADLDGLIFQAKLGTMLEKCERLRALAGWLAERLAPDAVEAAQRAALLAKADLLTEMVGEFPSLQGVMGREYALLAGEPPEVAQAIHEHYLPLRAGDRPPASTIGGLVGIADRIDTVVGCFGIGATPTGAADPFGLRRQTLGLLHILEAKGLRLSLAALAAKACGLYGDRLTEPREQVVANVLAFVRGRFVHDRVGRGLPQEIVEAAVAVGFDDPVDCDRRIEALATVSRQPEFQLLAGAFKRVTNILKDHEDATVEPSLFQAPAENTLYEALEKTRQAVAPLVAAGDYTAALTAMLAMKEPIDRFFDDVMVMVEDERLRANRLGLLAGAAALFRTVADFSKMYAMQQAG